MVPFPSRSPHSIYPFICARTGERRERGDETPAEIGRAKIKG